MVWVFQLSIACMQDANACIRGCDAGLIVAHVETNVCDPHGELWFVSVCQHGRVVQRMTCVRSCVSSGQKEL